MAIRDQISSSGNVFADLNLPKADDLLAKAELAAKVRAEIQRRRITQTQCSECKNCSFGFLGNSILVARSSSCHGFPGREKRPAESIHALKSGSD